MSQENKDIKPDLVDAVDSLLDEIEETAQSYAAPKAPAIDPNALITDDGTLDPGPSQSDASADADSESDQPVDSIDNAQQALDKLDEVEGHAEDLISMSADALLEQSEQAVSETTTEVADTPETNEPVDTTEQEEEPAPSDPVESEPTSEDSDADLLMESIDQLLQESPIDPAPDPEPEAIADDPIADPVAESPDKDSHGSDPQSITETDIGIEPQAEDEPVSASEEPTEVADDSETSTDADPESVSDVEPEAEREQISETEQEPESHSESELITEHFETSAGSIDDSMDMLDSALAEAADDMLDGDFETEEGELVSGEAIASAIEEALQAQGEADTAQSAAPDAPSTAATETEQSEALDPDTIDPDVAADLLGEAVSELLDEADAAESSTQNETQSPAEDQSEVPEPDAAKESEEPKQDAPATETSSEPAPAAVAAADDAPASETPSGPDPEVQSEIDALGQHPDKTHEREPITVPAWFERGVEIIRPKVDKIDPLKGKTMDAVAMGLGTVLVAAMTHATPLGASAMILVSKPLEKKSPEIRNAVGYIALWTGFLAAVVWIYLLMFRSTPIPTPESAPSRVISADEMIVPPVADPKAP